MQDKTTKEWEFTTTQSFIHENVLVLVVKLVQDEKKGGTKRKQRKNSQVIGFVSIILFFRTHTQTYKHTNM